ncbi:MAG TPA: phenylalanine--tRNA ligase subunit beta [Caulobacteraceae bacterium]|jgi:phenylalanyl-tRNA synthetase beta chain|nr:phenylalanine--tRNA ligase subunit beta [Caulobacteraceae bacterium]
MKFTLSWLKDHLDTDAGIDRVADAMTMAGLEVEEVIDNGSKLGVFTVAKVIEAVQHPNADRLRVCQVDTVDGRKEIVCGAPNARAGLTTIYAPLGAYIPGTGITLEARPVRGVVSNGMLCSGAELELTTDADGILELDDSWAVGAPAAQVFATEPAIDFEVTPNRPDWLGVVGIARDLSAAGVGRLKDTAIAPIAGKFKNPIEIRLSSPEACPTFAGRLIRGVKNGPSPKWLQDRLKAIGMNPKSMLVDVTNYVSFDRARPLHVYDADKLTGGFVEARLGRAGDKFLALNGEEYEITSEMCAIVDGSGAIGLGGVMGGESTGSSEATTDVFLESAWFDPLRTAQTSRATGINSDAAYRFARGVDPQSLVDGIELATRLILEVCGGEPSEVTLAGAPPAPPQAFEFDPGYVHQLAGLSIGREGVVEILNHLGFKTEAHGAKLKVTPPSWRRDVEGKADLVEEVARIAGYDSLPSTPLPDLAAKPAGVLNPLQTRVRAARRSLGSKGWQEAVTWSFTSRAFAETFGGGAEALVLENPIAAELDCMRPSILPNLIKAAARNASRGFPDAALFEIGPIYLGDGPADQRTAITALAAPKPARRWDGVSEDPLFALKADLYALLDELGAPTAALQVNQTATSPWWRPGRSARLQLGPKQVMAEFGELHPSVLKALDAPAPMLGFELILDALPESKRKATKTRPAVELAALMPLSRDFAFVVKDDVTAGDLVRAVGGADKQLISEVRVFDLYRGAGVPEGSKSLAVEVRLQPRDKTLTDAEIEAVSSKIVAAAQKLGAMLRS